MPTQTQSTPPVASAAAPSSILFDENSFPAGLVTGVPS
jgi:hypothetical protein